MSHDFVVYPESFLRKLECSLSESVGLWCQEWLAFDSIDFAVLDAFFDGFFKVDYEKVINGFLFQVENSEDFFNSLFGCRISGGGVDISSDILDAVVSDSVMSFVGLANLQQYLYKDIDLSLPDFSRISLAGGFVCLAVKCGLFRIRLIFRCVLERGEHVSNICFSSLREGISSERIDLDVFFNPIHMAVQDLQSLQVGDVVMINHSIDEPISVVDMIGNNFAAASVVRSGDFFALSLLRK